jgi:hypothetical protein
MNGPMRVNRKLTKAFLTVMTCVLVTWKFNFVQGHRAEPNTGSSRHKELHTGFSFAAVENDRDAEAEGLEECWIAAEIYPVVKCVKQRNMCKGSVTLEDSQICNVCKRGAPRH